MIIKFQISYNSIFTRYFITSILRVKLISSLLIPKRWKNVPACNKCRRLFSFSLCFILSWTQNTLVLSSPRFYAKRKKKKTKKKKKQNKTKKKNKQKRTTTKQQQKKTNKKTGELPKDDVCIDFTTWCKVCIYISDSDHFLNVPLF